MHITENTDMTDITKIDTSRYLEEADLRFLGANNEHELNEVKSLYLGKKGVLQPLFKKLGSMSASDRNDFGKKINSLRDDIEKLYDNAKKKLTEKNIEKELEHGVDVTLPGRTDMRGGRHPISLTIKRSVDILSTIGFRILDGLEIETEYYNFTAVNYSPNHPARNKDNVFYTNNNRVLRTHTYSAHMRNMLEQNKLPIRAISHGRVYRSCDNIEQVTFHQIDGVWIDNIVNFANLKSVMSAFLKSIFNDNEIKIRFTPSHFPLMEPAADCDVFHNGDWVNIAKCGMIHPNVITHSNIDSANCRGFAFTINIDKLAMLLYGVGDRSLFYQNDIRFLAQFHRT